MKIVVIGANGQVASEVCLILAGMDGVELRPVSRTRHGSAFLRYCGLPVAHGAIAVPEDARRLQEGADVIANFALPLGTPDASLRQNVEIIAQTFHSSPPTSTVVFFSTMAVYDAQSTDTISVRSPYASMKLRAEQIALELARTEHRAAFVLRLGHVAGEFQNITLQLRQELRDGPIRLPAPDRASNITFTATIADALWAIGNGAAGPGGLYDLVNYPQWSWREVYSYEARQLGLDVTFADEGQSAPPTLRTKLSRVAGHIPRHRRVRSMLERGLTLMPRRWNDYAKAKVSVDRARAEIAELTMPPKYRNAAALWPAVSPRVLPGLRPTAELLSDDAFRAAPREEAGWAQYEEGSWLKGRRASRT